MAHLMQATASDPAGRTGPANPSLPRRELLRSEQEEKDGRP